MKGGQEWDGRRVRKEEEAVAWEEGMDGEEYKLRIHTLLLTAA